MPEIESNVKVSLGDESVPKFLLKAHALAHAGRSEEALDLLTQERLEQWDDSATDELSRSSYDLVLGSTWRRLGRVDQAIEAYERVRACRSDVGVLHELIGLYRLQGRYSLALECSTEAMTQCHCPEITSLHAECLISLGRWAEGFRLYEELIETPQATCETQLQSAWYLSFLKGNSREILWKTHQAWARKYAPVAWACPHHVNDRSAQRRLKVGYLSADFYTHSVTYTFEPLLDGRDRDSVEVYGYGFVAHPDETTERLQGKFDHYRDIRPLEVRDIVATIQRDQIDILVTLAGHCSATCLQVMAYKPAPIQVDIGSVCSLGMPQIDYRITDALVDPPESQPFHTERLVYIPGGYFPYSPPREAPDIGPLPVLSTGQITFGSFANHLKINDDVVRVWSEILHRVKPSRLLIKSPGGRDPGVVENLLRRFEAQGISRQRVRVMGWLAKPQHWELYNQVDISLDTFPYNGGLTNLEALWMGVPSVTVLGETFVALTGPTILNHVGLKHLIARTPEEMVTKAVALAQNREVLERLRHGLRPALLASPLCDSQRIAREVEDAYREMWAQWLSVTSEPDQGRQQ